MFRSSLIAATATLFLRTTCHAQVFIPSDAVPPAADLPVIQRSAAFGDLDNDGDLDLFAPIDQRATISDPLPVLRRNDDGVYTDITLDAGLAVTDAIYTNSAVWFDADLDGWLDLYVGSYWFCCIAGSPAGKAAHPTIRNRLYRNIEGRFLEDITDPAGLDIRFDLIGGGTQGETGAADLDGDGWPDLYLGAGDTGFNYVFLNDRTGAFWEASGAFISIGVAPHAFDMGDVDNDGDLDIFQTAGLDSSLDIFLFRNLAGGQIDDVTIGSGLEDLPLSDNTDGGLIDIDNDGDLDVVLWGEDGVRFNDGGGQFTRPTIPTTLLTDFDFLSFDDADTDGDLDALLFNHGTTQPDLFINEAGVGNWLTLNLVGTRSNGSATGAVISVTAEGRTQRREVRSPRGMSRPVQLTHFGVGSAQRVEEILIRWPSGETTVLGDTGANQRLRIVESAGVVVDPEPSAPILLPVIPNPVSEGATFRLNIESGSKGRLSIYNLLGQRVITLCEAERLPGSHLCEWDTRDGRGARVAAGIYVARFEAAYPSVARKLLVLRQ